MTPMRRIHRRSIIFNVLDIFTRGIALVLGGFIFLNVAVALFDPSVETNVLFDVTLVSQPFRGVTLFIIAIAFLHYGLALRTYRGLKIVRIAAIITAIAIALINTIVFYRLLMTNTIQTPMIVPMSLILSGVLVIILWRSIQQGQSPRNPAGEISVLAIAGLCALAMPFVLMFCFGKTSYARQADAIVVFGARTYADGRPSDALADRVRTACDLYHQGLAPALLFSGGPGDGDVHETEAMRRMAIALGVPDENIILDTNGLSTQLTVDNCSASLGKTSPRILAVSHGYHLPRVKMAFERAGIRTYTVPAKETYLLTQMPIFMAREVGAYWKYYFTS